MSRILRNTDDILFYLKKETGFSEKIIKFVIDKYWLSLRELLQDETSDMERFIMTGFISLNKNLYLDAKRIATKLKRLEEKEVKSAIHLEKIEQLKKRLEIYEIQIKQRLHSTRPVDEISE